ncbi:plant UBX domain-containing protein 2 [Actinidia rufa]|uniref:Plant UBX domain-containing protein 2 n=1 Tax=Actinidia rufa TaxID=165716 RepID=A0A7J0DKN3_9ERIC|nr:plant UBX domain-containing protein 2 [Actinidia rufa]
MAEYNLGSMIVLSATNYAIWKPRMEDILFCKDLHDPLENKEEKPEAKKDEEWRKMNRKTIGLIRQCIGHEVFHHVAQETSAYDLWIKLEEMYQAKTSRNKALLMRRLVNLKLQRETTVAEHTSEFQSLVNQLTSVDLQFDDEMQALLHLSSLLESWETLVVSLSNSTPNGKLTTSMVMDALFNEEARRREMGSTDQSESQALVSEGSRERGRGQGRGHHRGTEKGRWRSQARGRTVRCFYCDQEGHIKRDCPKYKAQDQSSDTAATAVMVDDDEIEVLLAASEDGKSDWVLDSGSAYHLCRDREVFSTYAACKGRIWMANNTSSRVVGRGSVRFCMADGRSVTLTEGELLSDMGPMVLARRMDKGSNRCTEVRKASAGVPRGSGVDVHREAQRKKIKSILRSCTAKGAATPKRVSFALDLISGGGAGHLGEKVQGTSVWRCIHFGGKWSSPLMRLGISDAVLQSYGGAGLEVVRKDNLKTAYGSEEEVSGHVEICLNRAEANDASTGSELDENSSQSESRSELGGCVAVYVSGKPSDGSVEILLKLLRNSVKEPANAKFRRIRMGNPKIREAISEVTGCVELLEFVGFGL